MEALRNYGRQDYIAAVERHAADLGMTPPQLFRAAGFPHSTWYRWRNGTHAPQVRVLGAVLSYNPDNGGT